MVKISGYRGSTSFLKIRRGEGFFFALYAFRITQSSAQGIEDDKSLSSKSRSRSLALSQAALYFL